MIRFKHETEGSTAPDGLPDAALANLPRSARLHHGELYLDGEHVPGAKVLAHQASGGECCDCEHLPLHMRHTAGMQLT